MASVISGFRKLFLGEKLNLRAVLDHYPLETWNFKRGREEQILPILQFYSTRMKADRRRNSLSSHCVTNSWNRVPKLGENIFNENRNFRFFSSFLFRDAFLHFPLLFGDPVCRSSFALVTLSPETLSFSFLPRENY